MDVNKGAKRYGFEYVCFIIATLFTRSAQGMHAVPMLATSGARASW